MEIVALKSNPTSFIFFTQVQQLSSKLTYYEETTVDKAVVQRLEAKVLSCIEFPFLTSKRLFALESYGNWEQFT